MKIYYIVSREEVKTLDEQREVIVLSKEEEKEIQDCLLNFVVRVSSNGTPAELSILPDIVKILFDYCLERRY